jgi:hypothetical protein
MPNHPLSLCSLFVRIKDAENQGLFVSRPQPMRMPIATPLESQTVRDTAPRQMNAL